jgi:phosphoenolpyruvate---glycerone phosphotransferase subunit DhaL
VGRTLQRTLFLHSMNGQVSSLEIIRMAKGAAAKIRTQCARLSELDSNCGDGDHGTTMLRIVDRVAYGVELRSNAALRSLLRQTGLQVLGSDGGASSALLGAFLLGMAESFPEHSTCVDCVELGTALEAGLTSVQRHTHAKVGDKTLLDALIPAVTAFSNAAHLRNDIATALRDAASAAQAGAEATAALTARFGRGRFLGEKTRGHQDPGATTVALLFTGFYVGLHGRPEEG